jgi:hypothetical protein
VQFVRDIVKEVMGFAPYERRMMEVLRLGKEKRAQRFAKKRLGTHQRGVMVRRPARPARKRRRRRLASRPLPLLSSPRVPCGAPLPAANVARAVFVPNSVAAVVREQKKAQMVEVLRTMRR